MVLLQVPLLLVEVCKILYFQKLRILVFLFQFKDGKWNISLEEWPWANYPAYFLGAAVVMPRSTILPLFAASQTIPLMPFDDLYFTGICAEKANIALRFSSSSLA